jgi:hypothetical protein
MSYSAKPLDSVQTTSLVALAQAAVGCGIGLLVAGSLRRSTQRTVATAALTIGVLSAVPLVVDVIMKQVNRPGSVRSMRRSLESIRHGSGIEGVDIY